jgi:hypothetical protein
MIDKCNWVWVDGLKDEEGYNRDWKYNVIENNIKFGVPEQQ